MTNVSAKIPDAIFRQAKAIAENEEMTLDQFIAVALASQISSWETGRDFRERAQRGDWEKAKEILAKAPDVQPEEFDRL